MQLISLLADISAILKHIRIKNAGAVGVVIFQGLSESAVHTVHININTGVLRHVLLCFW